MIDVTKQLIIKNEPGCYIRPIVYTDYGNIGIIPKNSTYSQLLQYGNGVVIWVMMVYKCVRCIISDIFKTKPSHASNAKSCANYANSFLAKKKALDAGYDEAILLNQRGTIAEGPGENILLLKISS